MKKRIDSVEERYRSINIGESAKSHFGIKYLFTTHRVWFRLLLTVMYAALKHRPIKVSELFSRAKPGETLCNEALPSVTHSLSRTFNCHKFSNGLSKSTN